MESEHSNTAATPAADPAADSAAALDDTTVPAFMGTDEIDIESIRSELHDICESMRVTALKQSLQGRKRATRFTVLDTALKLSATVLASVAAVSAIAESTFGPWFTAGTAAGAALISGLQTTFNPAAKGKRLDECAIDWSEFRTAVHESSLIEVPCLRDASEARRLFRRLNQRWFELVRRSYLEDSGKPSGR
jgi:hypothetical protein